MHGIHTKKQLKQVKLSIRIDLILSLLVSQIKLNKCFN